MFRSIRWRLVLSYVFLIALTLGAVGAIILQLVEGYVQRQELEALTANAQAVASQARALMRPVVLQHELQELAQTSSFLGNAQVRILDSAHRVLADSRIDAVDDGAWLLLPEDFSFDLDLPGDAFGPVVVTLSGGQRLVLPASLGEWTTIFDRLPRETGLTLFRWQDGAWLSGFRFEMIQDAEEMRDAAVRADVIPRSQRAIQIPIGDERAPLGYVEIGRGPDLAAEAVATTRQAFLYAAGGVMLLAIVVGLLVSRGLAAPLVKLTEVAGRMSGGDLSIRAPVRGRDEIGRLAMQFNEMAGRLEASFADLAAERDALRRFVADASHELRTPITALKNYNDLLQGVASDDPSARAEFLADSQVQLDRLDWITGNLLDLSRLDGGLALLDLADHDVGGLIEAAVSAFWSLAQEKGITLSVLTPEPPLEVRCDRARIEMALSNLVDNALKFSPPGGEVFVGAESGEDTLSLWVRDSGPGIDPVDRPYIFDRFYQGKGTGAGGSGLGLSIVRSIAQAHGGQASVESETDAGSTFVIELPRGEPSN